jgi:hypothetical protein
MAFPSARFTDFYRLVLETKKVSESIKALRHQNQQSYAADDEDFSDGAINPAPSIHHAQSLQ